MGESLHKSFMKYVTIIVLYYCLFLSFCPYMNAQAQSLSEVTELDVTAEVDKEIVREGEIFTYTIIITGTEEKDIDIPDFGNKIADFPVVDSGTRQWTEGNKNIIEKWYQLKADTPGTYILPGVILSYKKNSKKLITETEQLNILVVSSEEQKKTSHNSAQEVPSGDIRDIKPLEKIAVPLSWYLIGSSVIVFVIIIAVLFSFFIKRKDKKIQPPLPPIPPYKTAREALNFLKNSNYLDSGQYKLFHYKLSEIFRNYLEAQYGFPATDLTTNEIIPYALKVPNLSEQNQKTLKDVLHDTDLVKFSDLISTKRQSLDLLNSVETFIDETYQETEAAEAGGIKT